MRGLNLFHLKEDVLRWPADLSKWRSSRNLNLKVIFAFLNGTVYFLIRHSIQFSILYKKALRYLYLKIYSLKDIPMLIE